MMSKTKLQHEVCGVSSGVARSDAASHKLVEIASGGVGSLEMMRGIRRAAGHRDNADILENSMRVDRSAIRIIDKIRARARVARP